MDKKLKKVELYYDDGIVGYIEGKELEKWEKANNTCATLMYSHGGVTGYEDIKWKTRDEIQNVKRKGVLSVRLLCGLWRNG